MTKEGNGLNCRAGHAFALLVALHFTVDFYGGLLTPLLEPTLTTHLRMGIGGIAALVGGWALLINIVQPVSGGLLPKRGMPVLLLAAPLAAACTVLIGLTGRLPGAIVVLAVSGIGIGLLHPEAALAVHSVSGRRAGAAVGLFMATGYLGFSIGGMAAGLWAEAWGLRGFWVLGLPAVLVVALGARAGLHRLHGHVTAESSSDETEGGLMPMLAVGVGIATAMCLLVRLVTLLLVRRFPEAAAQGWGGATVFATGVTGAAGAFFWGMQADRRGPMRVLAALQLGAIPFMVLLLSTRRIEWAPVWGLGLGATIGSSFPLLVVRARRTKGLTPRLRMGFTIGGSWGLGEAVFILAGRYINRFGEGDPVPVERILGVCAVLLLLNSVLAWRIRSRTLPVSPKAHLPACPVTTRQM